MKCAYFYCTLNVDDKTQPLCHHQCFKVPSVDDTSQEDNLKYFLASYCALNSNSKNLHASFGVC